MLPRPALERRAFVLRPPSVATGNGVFYTDDDLLRLREEVASGTEQRVRTDFEEWGRSLEERTGSAVADLHEAARGLREAHARLLEEAADEVTGLALAVARRILRREVEADPEVVLPLVRELLQRAAAGTQVTVHLTPRDHAILSAHDALPESAGLEGVHFRLDAGVTPGGVLVETAAGGLDGRIETQLELIEAALRAPREEAV